MANISSKLGQNMKRIRTKKNMSQGDIARALEVDRGYISNIESGKKNLTLATIQRLADALGVSVDELLKWNKITKIYVGHTDITKRNYRRIK